MDNLHLISWVLNGVLAVLLYLMRTQLEDTKGRMETIEKLHRELAKEVVDVKVHYLLKDDFSEFKDELWRKLDDLKEIVRHKDA